MKTRRFLALALSFMLFGASAEAAEPSGYYDDCKGKGGKDLLNALYQTIGSHTNVGYDGLWDVYKTSDIHPDGTVWDMYSTKNWGTPSRAKRCGNYSAVGDCINREHSMPKSWFREGSPMKSDAFHIYPTDGKVNNQRGNYPYGECANGTTLPPNGNVKALGRLGSSTFPGYSGTVFEPDDRYKGDFARSYFYMAAAYYNKIAGWNSDMLAGNNYPAYKSWAVDLLLKWHRQDPVSDKETARNDAVDRHQHNRNPFIDHPELAEYIWGDKKNSKWYGEDVAEGSFVLPVDGSTVDMGTTGVGIPVSATIDIHGKALASPVSVSATNALQLSATSISADDANAGTAITVTWTLKQAGSYTSVLTLTSGAAKTSVTVKARVQDGLPATAATEISTYSFRANWAYVGDDTDGHYSLDVRQNGTSIDGYPRDVDAAAGHYTVDGLQENTTYTYTLSSATMTSNTVTVTTGEPLPYIEFLYDGDQLSFSSTPGIPSAPEELLVDIENVSQTITVSVTAPFEISSDRTDWGTTLTMQPQEDRIYMRFNPDRTGSFTTSITAKAGDYVAQTGTITGVCVDEDAAFLETFEANVAKTYTTGPYVGSASNWNFEDVGVVNIGSAGDRIYDGNHSCRFGKDETSAIEMTDDKPFGAGTVSFYACRWINTQGNVDPEAALDVLYSIDGGDTWEKAGAVTVSESQYTQYSVSVKVIGNVRIRIAQTAGKRIHLDNVAISDYKETGISDPVADNYHSWDAYAPAPGTLCVESEKPATADIHRIDGITFMSAAAIAAGNNVFSLPEGLYIIVIDGQSRRVLVK